MYKTRTECESRAKGYSGASYKKYNSLSEAQAFIDNVQPQAKKFKHDNTSSIKNQHIDIELTKIVTKLIKRPDLQTHFNNLMSKKNNNTSGGSSDCDLSKEFLQIPEYLSPKPLTSKSLSTTTFKNISKISIEFETPGRTKLRKFKNLNFHIDSDDFVHVYTSGFCFEKLAPAYGIHFGVNHNLNHTELLTKSDNNLEIIQAIIQAIESAEFFKIKKLKVFIDINLKKEIENWISDVSSMNNLKKIDKFGYLEKLLENKNMIVKICFISSEIKSKFNKI